MEQINFGKFRLITIISFLTTWVTENVNFGFGNLFKSVGANLYSPGQVNWTRIFDTQFNGPVAQSRRSILWHIMTMRKVAARWSRDKKV